MELAESEVLFFPSPAPNLCIEEVQNLHPNSDSPLFDFAILVQTRTTPKLLTTSPTPPSHRCLPRTNASSFFSFSRTSLFPGSLAKLQSPVTLCISATLSFRVCFFFKSPSPPRLLPPEHLSPSLVTLLYYKHSFSTIGGVFPLISIVLILLFFLLLFPRWNTLFPWISIITSLPKCKFWNCFVYRPFALSIE